MLRDYVFAMEIIRSHCFTENIFSITGGSCHKYQVRVCGDKHVLVATKHVFCRDKSMLAPRQNVCRHKIMFVSTKLMSRKYLSRQRRDCCDRYLSRQFFVTTNILLSRQKTRFVTIKVKLVATKLCLSRQMLFTEEVFWTEIIR